MTTGLVYAILNIMEPSRRKRREPLVYLRVMITPNQRMLLEREADATDKPIAMIVREALNDRYRSELSSEIGED